MACSVAYQLGVDGKVFIVSEEVFSARFFDNVQREVNSEHCEGVFVLMVEGLAYGVVACADFFLVVLEEGNIAEGQVDVVFAAQREERAMNVAPYYVVPGGDLSDLDAA